jgi:hypothetical protein
MALSWFVPAVVAGTFWTAAATLVAVLGPPLISHACAALLIVPFAPLLPWAGQHLPHGLVMALTFAGAWALNVGLFWIALGGLGVAVQWADRRWGAALPLFLGAAALLLALATLAVLAAGW